MLDEADYSILAFRLEGNKVYYLNFRDLKPYLTEEALINNERQGDHWNFLFGLTTYRYYEIVDAFKLNQIILRKLGA